MILYFLFELGFDFDIDFDLVFRHDLVVVDVDNVVVDVVVDVVVAIGIRMTVMVVSAVHCFCFSCVRKLWTSGIVVCLS